MEEKNEIYLFLLTKKKRKMKPKTKFQNTIWWGPWRCWCVTDISQYLANHISKSVR